MQIFKLEGPRLCRPPPAPKGSPKFIKKIQNANTLSREIDNKMTPRGFPNCPKSFADLFFLLPKTGIVSACVFFSLWMLPGPAATVNTLLIPL